MECVNMRSKGPRFLSLEVPGLAEKRPSLVCGDCIFAKLSSGDPNEATAYQVCTTSSNSKACDNFCFQINEAKRTSFVGLYTSC